MSGTTHKTTKGYLRITAGPHRHQYLHRLVAAAMLGRKLHKSEQVHHLDNNKHNCWFTNLYVLGEKDHGWVSAKQAWFVANVVAARDKREWDEFFERETKKQQQQIAACKAIRIPVPRIKDGTLQKAWDAR